MQDFGPIHPEKDEPVFHARWEGRQYAIFIALAVLRKWNLDMSRQVRERLPPAEYLSLSYFQLNYAMVVELLDGSGLAKRAEIESGRPARGFAKAVPQFTAARVSAFFAAGAPRTRNIEIAPKFEAGQRVRARNINPVTHTRLPRYARGKFGTVEHDHGIFVFPDSNAQGLGENPQHLYTVRFAARELWGDQAKPKDTVIVAMWDDYLEAV
jgi:nitrile hydratase